MPNLTLSPNCTSNIKGPRILSDELCTLLPAPGLRQQNIQNFHNLYEIMVYVYWSQTPAGTTYFGDSSGFLFAHHKSVGSLLRPAKWQVIRLVFKKALISKSRTRALGTNDSNKRGHNKNSGRQIPPRKV